MRRILSAVVISTLALSLTGCAAGFNAATRDISQVTDGAEASIISTENNIRVVNLLVVAAESGTGVLVGTIVNAQETEDSLLGVAINGTVLTYTGKNNLPQNSPIIFEGERATAKVVLGGFGAPAGSRVQVGLFFAKAGVVNLDAIVREARDEYAGVTGTIDVPMVSPSPTASK